MPTQPQDPTLADWLCVKCLFKTGPSKGEPYVNRGSRTTCNGGCGVHKGSCNNGSVKTTGSPTRSAAAGKTGDGRDQDKRKIAQLEKQLADAEKKNAVVPDATPPDSASGAAGDDGAKQLRAQIQLYQAWIDAGADLYVEKLAAAKAQLEALLPKKTGNASGLLSK